MWCARRTRLRMRQLSGLRLGPLRVNTPWSELDRRERGTHFIAITARSIVNRSVATQMVFASINPFIGCEFGCSYCYARETHRWTVERAARGAEPPPNAVEAESLAPALAFERRILVKQNAANLLSHLLARSQLRDQYLVIGTATDPYQPA